MAQVMLNAIVYYQLLCLADIKEDIYSSQMSRCGFDFQTESYAYPPFFMFHAGILGLGFLVCATN